MKNYQMKVICARRPCANKKCNSKMLVNGFLATGKKLPDGRTPKRFEILKINHAICPTCGYHEFMGEIENEGK